MNIIQHDESIKIIETKSGKTKEKNLFKTELIQRVQNIFVMPEIIEKNKNYAEMTPAELESY